MRNPSLRRGFTLTELLISIVIIGIIGIAFTKMLMVQSRFFELQYSRSGARAVDRNAVNVMLSELRMVQDSGGVDSLTADGKLVRLRVPYWFGLVCGGTAATLTASMLPIDSSVAAMASYVGYAYRNANSGRYTYVTGTLAPAAALTPATCTGTLLGQANIQTVSMNGRSGVIYDLTPGAASATAMQPMFLWQHVTYQFKTSNAFPAYYGLFRTVQGGSTDELMAPFDTSAGFKIYKQGKDTATTTFALSDTLNVRGLDIYLPGRNSQTLVGHTPATANVRTAVFFKNTRSF